MDAARDSRLFNSLQANRAAQAQRQQQFRDEAGVKLDWQRLLTNAALAAQNRNDDLSQREFVNRLGLARFNQDVAGAGQHQSNTLADLALRRRAQDLQFGPEQQSDRALGRFATLAPSFADDPSITEESIGALRPDLTPDDLAVAKAMFRTNRRKLMEDEAERANATEMANRQILTEQREGYADKLLPTITQETVPDWASTSWFGKARKGDVEPFRAKILAEIMSDTGKFPALPPSDAAAIFREVSRNRKMEPSPYDEEAGRFQFTPRFSAQPAAGGKVLDVPTATMFLQRAGGDKDVARRMAREAGYAL